MDLKQLMIIRAKRLEDFEASFNQMSFSTEEAKNLFYEASMNAMTDFFQDALLVILNEESEVIEKKRAA